MIVTATVAALLLFSFIFHLNKRTDGVKYLFTTDMMLSLPPFSLFVLSSVLFVCVYCITLFYAQSIALVFF